MNEESVELLTFCYQLKMQNKERWKILFNRCSICQLEIWFLLIFVEKNYKVKIIININFDKI